MNTNLSTTISPDLIASILGPLIVGLIIWLLGERSADRRLKYEAIRDLMTFRGDYASQNFREALNRISIVFHNDEEIRVDVRHLYDVINNPSSQQKSIERTIVGLIYKLCHENGFGGLTEYDIDQSFVVPQQEPDALSTNATAVKGKTPGSTKEDKKSDVPTTSNKSKK